MKLYNLKLAQDIEDMIRNGESDIGMKVMELVERNEDKSIKEFQEKLEELRVKTDNKVLGKNKISDVYLVPVDEVDLLIYDVFYEYDSFT